MRKDLKISLIIVGITGIVGGYTAARLFAPGLVAFPRVITEPLPSESAEPKEAMPLAPDLPGRMGVKVDSQAQVGETVTAEIWLDTQGETISGFDVILEFDPSAWQIVSPTVETADTQAFSTYPVNSIDSEAGKVRLSGLTDLNAGFTGDIVVGSFLLQPQKPGSLEITLVYAGPRQGKDSNLAEQGTGKDMLGGVESGTVEVQ